MKSQIFIITSFALSVKDLSEWVKARLKVAADIDAAAAIAAAKADPAVAAALEGKQLVKEIYVKGRLVNLAVKG